MKPTLKTDESLGSELSFVRLIPFPLLSLYDRAAAGALELDFGQNMRILLGMLSTLFS